MPILKWSRSSGQRFAIGVLLAVIGLAVFLILRREPMMAHNSGAREILAEKLRKISAKCGGEVGLITRQSATSSGCDVLFAISSENWPSSKSLDLVQSYGVAVNWRVDEKRRECLFFPTPTSEAIRLFASGGDSQGRRAIAPLLVMVPISQLDYATLPVLKDLRTSPSENVGDTQTEMIRHRLSEFGMEYACAMFTDGSIRFVPLNEL